MKKVKSYLIELTIVTFGVLIALLLNNFKESYQAEKYQKASLETIKNEVESNYSELKDIIEKQSRLLDTIKTYNAAHISIADLFHKAGGLQVPTLSNSGSEFYKRNQINSIDFDVMASLTQMNKLSDLIDTKFEKLMDFAYQNIFVDSKDSKMKATLYLRDALGTEKQLLLMYQTYIGKHNKDESK